MSDAYTAGFLSGIAQTIVGHPLDTIKVWAQGVSAMPAGAVGGARLGQLYAGVTYPLMSAGIINATSFGVANSTTKYGHFYSGVTAGLAAGMIAAPMDYYKIQRQIHHHRLHRQPGHGRLALVTTLVRDAVGYGVYFPVYYALKDRIGTFNAGGVAGIVSWTVIYPLDTIKTRIQSGSRPEGLSGLWKGYAPCMIRAGLVNAVGWVIYDALKVLP